MTFIETELKGCYILEPQIFGDDRGYFMESFNQARFDEAVGARVNFVQDNQSFSTKGVLRGLHYQIGAHAQAKLVRVLNGKVLDIAVDLRKKSPTFGHYLAIELSAENKKQMYIPKGFAHGFVVLSEAADFFYKCDYYYNKESEGGIYYADPTLAIDWKLPQDQLIVSEKDLVLPSFKNARL
jgi:dTDP-4-dehydrorhamnose 3,5-epimerase